MNYASHRWKTHRENTPNGLDVHVYCERCGCENGGDPSEFPALNYPACEATTAEAFADLRAALSECWRVLVESAAPILQPIMNGLARVLARLKGQQ